MLMDEKHLNISTVNVTKNLSVHLIDFTRLLDLNGVCENDFICHLFLSVAKSTEAILLSDWSYNVYTSKQLKTHYTVCSKLCLK